MTGREGPFFQDFPDYHKAVLPSFRESEPAFTGNFCNDTPYFLLSLHKIS